MKTKTFIWILAIVLLLGTVFTICHLLYMAEAYEHSSIIQFIAGENW